MKACHRAVLMGLLAIGSFVVSANSAVPSTEQSAEESAIRKIDLAWSQAAQKKDLEGTVAPYAADAYVLPFNAPLASGTAEIRQLWSSLMSKPGFVLKFSPTRIFVAASKDIAWEVGTFELTLNDQQGNGNMVPGKYVVTWKKVGGTWKAAADIFNTDK
jgi:ketosteroid isomerase-like protein